MNNRTYFEHAAGDKPELEVVEFKSPADAEAAALRLLLVRVTAERDFYRTQFERLARDVCETAKRTQLGGFNV